MNGVAKFVFIFGLITLDVNLTYYFLWKLTSPINTYQRYAFGGENLSYRNQFGYNSTLQTTEIFAGTFVTCNDTIPINFDYTKFVTHFLLVCFSRLKNVSKSLHSSNKKLTVMLFLLYY